VGKERREVALALRQRLLDSWNGWSTARTRGLGGRTASSRLHGFAVRPGLLLGSPTSVAQALEVKPILASYLTLAWNDQRVRADGY